MKKSNGSLSSSSQESYRLAGRSSVLNFQEHLGKKRGPARQTEINLDKFRESIFYIDIFRVGNIYSGKFRDGKYILDIFRED